MHTVSMLIKPASGRCNLRCRYCFYEDVSENRTQYDLGMMSEETLDHMVKEAMALADERVIFAFQGGEPMVRGLPFFRKFIECERKYRRDGLEIEHVIQTNATLVDEEWADFFYENHFLVGVSIDGRQVFHDRYRVYANGKGSWEAVRRGFSVLREKHVLTNILCVVTEDIARRGKAAYRGLKALGTRYIQFIPCLDPLEKERGGHDFSLSPEQYGEFLKTVFDLYYEDWAKGEYISVRLFDDYVHLIAGMYPGACATTGSCGSYFVVEGDGSVYPCDFYVLDRYCLGKIGERPMAEMTEDPVAVRFCVHGRGYPAACTGCRWLKLCGGGCQRDWIGDERNYHCAAFRSFFEYAYPRLEYMADAERRMHSGRTHL